MSDAEPPPISPDAAYDLQRFVAAQEEVYETALSELRAGRKQTHWMWFIFPQFAGLGWSPVSAYFAIKSLDEAQAYRKHPVLGPRLLECCEAVAAISDRSANEIFGSPDDLKLRSSVTLFAHTPPPHPIFQQLIDRYYGGVFDQKTLTLIAAA